MLNKVVSYAAIVSIFLVFSMSSAHAMEEDPVDASSQYLTILQKAYQGDPKSIDGLYDCLMRQSLQSRKEFLSFLHEMASDSLVPSEVVARQVKSFIDFYDQEGDSDVCAQYLAILQKAYQGNSNSTDGLYDCLVRLKEILPNNYKTELSRFYNQALNPDVQPKKFARQIRMFIEHEQRRLCPSPFIYFGDHFRRDLLASLTKEERRKIKRLQKS
ncbi:MAG: hypothetical protein K2X28_08195 [Alphaproteobacteria bacterium]|nr:hypothetical protein [Alphaproteobacteria bacterium]